MAAEQLVAFKNYYTSSDNSLAFKFDRKGGDNELIKINRSIFSYLPIFKEEKI